MNRYFRAAVLAAGALVVAPFAFGQTPRPADGGTASPHSFTHGESRRCESLGGAQKDQCDKEEATKTQGAAAQDASGGDGQSAAGASSRKSDPKTFTHGESKRCESLAGAAKDECDKEEARE